MGSFYLDVIKDRQYTAKRGSLAQRSCQTAMYHIVQALVRWITPILSFTGDEIWQVIPGQKESLFMAEWYQGLFDSDERINDQDWFTIRSVKDAVNKAIEGARSSMEMGSSLEAEVDLYVEPTLHSVLAKLHNDLRFVLITSRANIHAGNAPAHASATDVDGLKLVLTKSSHGKCVRCWHRRPDIGQHAAHPELCGRCVENVDGDGEVRAIA